MVKIRTDRLQRLVRDKILTRKVEVSKGFHPLVTTEWYQGENLIAHEDHYSDFGMSSEVEQKAVISLYTSMPVEKVRKGEYIRLKDTETAPVYIRGEYSSLDWPRGEGRYECGAFDDISKSRYLKKGTIVYVGFDF